MRNRLSKALLQDLNQTEVSFRLLVEITLIAQSRTFADDCPLIINAKFAKISSTRRSFTIARIEQN